MIPYFEQPSGQVGPLTIHAFGAIVAGAAIAGDLLYMRRLREGGLDPRVGSALAGYALVTGFITAHLFALVLYFPDKVTRDPWSLLRVWEDLSSFGGMIGGALAAVMFLKLHGRDLTSEQRWGYLDRAAFVLPFAWAIGRLACALAHDHPGRITSFPLAVSLSSATARDYIGNVYAHAGLSLPQEKVLSQLGFHDLGLYEMLYLALVVCPLFLVFDRVIPKWRTSTPGWWVAAFALLYAPARLLLDTLRVGDARYFGLTPGQYAALAMLAGGLLVLWRGNKSRQLNTEG